MTSHQNATTYPILTATPMCCNNTSDDPMMVIEFNCDQNNKEYLPVEGVTLTEQTGETVVIQGHSPMVDCPDVQGGQLLVPSPSPWRSGRNQ